MNDPIFFLTNYYLKNGEVWKRHLADSSGDHDMRLYDVIKDIAKKYHLSISAEDPDMLVDEMLELTNDGTDTLEGVIAMLYYAATQAAYLEGEKNSWIPVEAGLQEESEKMFRTAQVEGTTVLAVCYTGNSSIPKVEKVNRCRYNRSGIPALDEELVNALGIEFDKWIWRGRFTKITHWQPLPKLPQDKRD